MNNYLLLLITAFIIFSCLFDFKTRKIPNALNLTIFLISLGLGVYLFQWHALASFVIVSLSLLPLYILGVFGGGDYKLFSSLSFLIPKEVYFELLFYTLLWAAAYSIIKLVAMHGKDLPYKLHLSWKKVLENNKIPMTLPYLLAWLSLIRLGGLS